MSVPKEPWFFCDDFDTGYPDTPRTIEDYHKVCFSHLEEGCCLAIGEASPVYLASEVAIANILDYNPEARFIVMLRNPVEIVCSLHRGRTHHGERHENLSKLRDAWEAQELRAKGEALPPEPIKPILLQYKLIAFQGSQLRRLVERAGEDKVLVVFFEDLNRSFNTEYQRVLGFLGLPPREIGVTNRVLPTVSWRGGMAKMAYDCLVKCAA